MKNIRIVIVSKDESLRMTNDFIKQSIFQDDINVTTSIILNNKESICKCYNTVLDEVRTSAEKYDYVFFMHADVQTDLNNLITQVIEHSDKYDVFGLCGCDKISYGVTPLNWFNGSKQYPENRWGFVYHGEVNAPTYFSQHSSDVTHHPVSCIDGLCIIFGPKAIETDMRFDETFMFDHYDTDISFQTIIDYDLNLGIIVDMMLQHWSIGKSITTDSFRNSELKFREKWDKYFKK